MEAENLSFSYTFLKLLAKYPPTMRAKPFSNAQVVEALKNDSLKYHKNAHTAHAHAVKEKESSQSPLIIKNSEKPIDPNFHSSLSSSIKQNNQYLSLVYELINNIQQAPSNSVNAKSIHIMSQLFRTVLKSKKRAKIGKYDLSYARVFYTKNCLRDKHNFFLCVEILLYCKAQNLSLFKHSSSSMSAKKKTASKPAHKWNKKANNGRATPRLHVSVVLGDSASLPQQAVIPTVTKDDNTYGAHADKCLLCDNKTHAGTAYCQYHLREQGWTLK